MGACALEIDESIAGHLDCYCLVCNALVCQWIVYVELDGVNMAKEKLILSFSGGRTSAYMTRRMLNEYSHLYDMIVLFANTGMEHEKTLEFVHQCDVNFNFKTVWL